MRHLALVALLFLPSAHAAEPRLGAPLACTLGVDCMVQSYVEHGGEGKDYRCGNQSYKSNDGTAFRVSSPLATVPVLAVLPGRVRGIRDGEDDGLFFASGREAVKGKECGNGVVIEHDNGYSSQYCHMAKGSLAVKAGEMVKAGQALGKVGLSGLTEFRHVHLTLRHKGKVIDPFASNHDLQSCGTEAKNLWDEALQDRLSYRDGVIFLTGFSGIAVDAKTLEANTIVAPHAKSEVLVAYALAINLKAGDQLVLTVTGPDGKAFGRAEAAPLERDKAQNVLLAGKRLNNRQSWPNGRYAAVYEIRRVGNIHARKEFSFTLGQ